ncbi:DUF6263 family protein [Robiginitalea marina]|uniref:DUF6263 family protein n=1 Tax=Robiginitalea marina TaxID=2954105 RepID=A0ABT1B0B5_9FLAO|nr:DUF6263 family protein [Robiginitalea marina]MCO5725307.1 DUF6263 family protein [Robiginitalea marina]
MQKVLAILCVFVGFQGAVYSQVMLEYRLREGDVFTFEQQAEQRVSQTLEETTQVLTNRISGILQYRVLKVREKGYLLEFLFRDLVFQIEDGQGGILLDVHASEPQNGDAQSMVFNALLNVPVQMEIDRKGKILQVSGGDSLVSQVIQKSGVPEGFARTVMRKSLEQEYGSEALARSYEQMTYLYSGTPVQVGDQWRNAFGGKLQAKNLWRLDSLTTDRASISGKAEVTMRVEEPSMTMELTGKQESTLSTDRHSGFILEMRVTNQARGISTLSQTGPLEVPTVVTSNVVYRLIDQKHVQ